MINGDNAALKAKLLADFSADLWALAVTAESAVKKYKQRLTGPGTYWSRSGVQRMIVLRSTILDDSFNDFWQAA